MITAKRDALMETHGEMETTSFGRNISKKCTIIPSERQPQRGNVGQHLASHKQLLSMRKWYSENDEESPSLVQLTSLWEQREEDEDGD